MESVFTVSKLILCLSKKRKKEKLKVRASQLRT